MKGYVLVHKETGEILCSQSFSVYLTKKYAQEVNGGDKVYEPKKVEVKILNSKKEGK